MKPVRFTGIDVEGRVGTIARYKKALTEAGYSFTASPERILRWPQQGVLQVRSDFSVECAARGDKKKIMETICAVKSTPFN